MNELIKKLNRLKEKVKNNPKQNYNWLYEGEFKQEYSVANIKHLEEHEDNVHELLLWLWNFKEYLKNKLISLNKDTKRLEELINDDKNLVIVADLANWLKHGELRNSRSKLCI